MKQSPIETIGCRGCDNRIRPDKESSYCKTCGTHNRCKRCQIDLREDRNEGYYDGSLCRDCEDQRLFIIGNCDRALLQEQRDYLNALSETTLNKRGQEMVEGLIALTDAIADALDKE